MSKEKVPVSRPVVQVIGITPLPKRQITVSETYGYREAMTRSEMQSVEGTVVLYTADGELKTKTFDGKWTLAQVSNWKIEEN